MPDPIQTRHEYPPIPDRSHDWCAWRNPEVRAVYAPTERRAVLALLDQEYWAGENEAWTEDERRMHKEYLTACGERVILQALGNDPAP
jgi:hypothetical protein